VSPLGDLSKTRASRVIGIDASTKSLAFCVFYNRRPVKWGKINFEGSDVYERIRDAHPKVRALADEFDADFVCLEGAILANNKNVKVTIDLSLMYGAILSVLLEGRAKVVQVTPTVWQNFIGNKVFSQVETAKMKADFPDKSASWYTNKKREIRKQRTMDFFNAKWPHMNLTDNDVGDAAGIAYHSYYELTRRK
jgi:Holliday junction resolvasome RuvABC endonuclease subunit